MTNPTNTPAALAETLASLIEGSVTSDNGNFGIRIRRGRFNIGKVDLWGTVWAMKPGRSGGARLFNLGKPDGFYTLEDMAEKISLGTA